MLPVSQKHKIQKSLLIWFEKSQRDLPWRKTRDPYAIWVSEIMLQQTQVATVIPYYKEFLKTFPTVRHLAKAGLSEVLKIWEGLGYYSRARNLHKASRVILNHFKGKIPDALNDLLSLPGIGRYTAGAILSIAYNQEAPILDGNVKKVLSRLFAVSSNPLGGKTEGLLWQLSETLIPTGHASSFNQALMDLGSMVCTLKNPQCPRCPFLKLCKAKSLGNPERYPARQIKKKIPHIDAVAAVIQKDGKVLVWQRPLRGLLGGLWEFPNWKTEGVKDLKHWLRHHLNKEKNVRIKIGEYIGPFHQAFSHFRLSLQAFHCQLLEGNGKGKWISPKKLSSLPMPRLHRRIANSLKLRSS